MITAGQHLLSPVMFGQTLDDDDDGGGGADAASADDGKVESVVVAATNRLMFDWRH